MERDESLARMWGVDECDRCGRTVILGERVAHTFIAGRPATVCSECLEPALPKAQGFVFHVRRKPAAPAPALAESHGRSSRAA
jgi:hypothetical protein